MAEKKKILFIYPPSPVMNRADRCQQPVEDLLVIPPLPPKDLMYMAAVAEKITKPTYFEAKIIDYSLGGATIEKFIEDMRLFQPDYLVLNVASTTFENDLSVVDIAKEILPQLVIIAKGAHFLTYNTDVLYKYKALDLVIVGEPEETLKEILEAKPYDKIKGLCYRDGFMAKFTGARPFIKNLDKLPFPARHLVNNNLFRRPDNNKVQAIIEVSRGCSHYCFFCLATPVSGAKVRYRSPENIIEEINECVENYGIKNFLFWADNFTDDVEWVKDLCTKLIESELDITWSANTRADIEDEEMIDLMYQSGCRLVSMGIESGSQFILDKIGKKITIDSIRTAVRLFKEAKIKIYNYFVIGLPWDNEQTIEETIQLACFLNSDFVSFYTAVPLPGTRFYKFACENSLLKEKDSFEGAYYQPTINTMCLSKERVFELHKKAVKRFYLRPKYIFKAIANIRSFSELKNYFKMGLSILIRR